MFSNFKQPEYLNDIKQEVPTVTTQYELEVIKEFIKINEDAKYIKEFAIMEKEHKRYTKPLKNVDDIKDYQKTAYNLVEFNELNTDVRNDSLIYKPVGNTTYNKETKGPLYIYVQCLLIQCKAQEYKEQLPREFWKNIQKQCEPGTDIYNAFDYDNISNILTYIQEVIIIIERLYGVRSKNTQTLKNIIDKFAKLKDGEFKSLLEDINRNVKMLYELNISSVFYHEINGKIAKLQEALKILMRSLRIPNENVQSLHDYISSFVILRKQFRENELLFDSIYYLINYKIDPIVNTISSIMNIPNALDTELKGQKSPANWNIRDIENHIVIKNKSNEGHKIIIDLLKPEYNQYSVYDMLLCNINIHSSDKCKNISLFNIEHDYKTTDLGEKDKRTVIKINKNDISDGEISLDGVNLLVNPQKQYLYAYTMQKINPELLQQTIYKILLLHVCGKYTFRNPADIIAIPYILFKYKIFLNHIRYEMHKNHVILSVENPLHEDIYIENILNDKELNRDFFKVFASKNIKMFTDEAMMRIVTIKPYLISIDEIKLRTYKRNKAYQVEPCSTGDKNIKFCKIIESNIDYNYAAIYIKHYLSQAFYHLFMYDFTSTHIIKDITLKIIPID